MTAIRHLTALALATVLAACAGSPPPTSIPAATRSSQGWIVTRAAAAADVVQGCPDGIAAEAEDLYAPDRNAIDQLETLLPALAPDARLDAFDRQYVGVVLDGRQAIYLRGIPRRDHRREDPARQSVGNCHSGYEVLFDPAERRFRDLRLLDSAPPMQP